MLQHIPKIDLISVTFRAALNLLMSSDMCKAIFKPLVHDMAKIVNRIDWEVLLVSLRGRSYVFEKRLNLFNMIYQHRCKVEEYDDIFEMHQCKILLHC